MKNFLLGEHLSCQGIQIKFLNYVGMDHFLSVNGKARGQADSRLNKGYTEHKMMASKRKKKKKKARI